MSNGTGPAVVGKRDLLQLADPGQKGRGPYCFLSGTLTANPVACAAGLATLDVLRHPGVYDRLRHIGGRLAGSVVGRDAPLAVRLQLDIC